MSVSKRTLPWLALALSALALPGERRRDVLGLLGGDSDAYTSTTDLHTLTPTRSSVRSWEPTVTTSQSSEEQRTPTPVPWTDSVKPAAVKTALGSTSVQPTSAEGYTTDRSSKTWQSVCITVIAVLFITASIACAMFFDRLCKFLKDVICCTSRPLNSEEFIPDGEQSGATKSLSSDWNTCRAGAIQPRELPWNTDTKSWKTLHRHPSCGNDRPPST